MSLLTLWIAWGDKSTFCGLYSIWVGGRTESSGTMKKNVNDENAETQLISRHWGLDQAPKAKTLSLQVKLVYKYHVVIKKVSKIWANIGEILQQYVM